MLFMSPVFLKTFIYRVSNPKFLEIWQFPKYVLFNFKRFYLALDLALFIYWVSDPSLRIMPFQIYLLILFCMGLIPKIIVIGLCSLKDIALVSSFVFLVSDLAFYSLVSDPKFLNRTELPQWFWFIYIVFYYASSAIVVFILVDFCEGWIRSSTLFLSLIWGLLPPISQQEVPI